MLLEGYTSGLKEIFPDGPQKKLLEPHKVLLKSIGSGDPDEIDRAIDLHAEEERFFALNQDHTDQ